MPLLVQYPCRHGLEITHQPEQGQQAQAEAVVAELAANGVAAEWNSDLVALIAYLQRLGTDIRAEVAKGGAP